MKIRNGFVSNSSSSSFIIAWNEEKDIEANGFKMNINKFMRYIDCLANFSADSTHVENSTKYGVIQHIEDNDWSDKNELIEKINKYENACFLHINYDDEMTRDLLEWMKNSGIIDIITNYND